jgi:5-oxoprolinase (ATP-hydrolysing) subunit A
VPRSTLDINVDMGESFGLWRLGDDEALLPYIVSEHRLRVPRRDPGTIRRTGACGDRARRAHRRARCAP